MSFFDETSADEPILRRIIGALCYETYCGKGLAIGACVDTDTL